MSNDTRRAGPTTMLGDPIRQPSWDIIKSGRVWRVTALDNCVCTHEQAFDAINMTHQRGGDRVYFDKGLVLRVEHVGFPDAEQAKANPARALVLGAGAGFGTHGVTDWREDDQVVDDAPSGTYDPPGVYGVERTPFDAMAAAGLAANRYVEKTRGEMIDEQLRQITPRFESLVNEPAEDPLDLYRRMSGMNDGPRLRNLLAQAESYHAQAIQANRAMQKALRNAESVMLNAAQRLVDARGAGKSRAGGQSWMGQ